MSSNTPEINKISEIAFSPTVRQIQTRKGSRNRYAKVDESGSWTGSLNSQMIEFIARQRSFFMSSVSADGQPYIQHRGGPPGFLKALDQNTLGFANFRGNQQFITQGNLEDNSKSFIFLMDYETRQRLKLWGNAQVIEDDKDLVNSLMPAEYEAQSEQAIIFKIALWNMNCRQHIPQRYEAADVVAALEAQDKRIAELETELASIRGE